MGAALVAVMAEAVYVCTEKRFAFFTMAHHLRAEVHVSIATHMAAANKTESRYAEMCVACTIIGVVTLICFRRARCNVRAQAIADAIDN